MFLRFLKKRRERREATLKQLLEKPGMLSYKELHAQLVRELKLNPRASLEEQVSKAIGRELTDEEKRRLDVINQMQYLGGER